VLLKNHESWPICLTNIQGVDTTRQGVKTNNDTHVVLPNGVGGNLLQVLLLIAVVQLRAGDLDPSSVGCRDAKKVDTFIYNLC
jgi:hypothetical protein